MGAAVCSWALQRELFTSQDGRGCTVFRSAFLDACTLAQELLHIAAKQTSLSQAAELSCDDSNCTSSPFSMLTKAHDCSAVWSQHAAFSAGACGTPWLVQAAPYDQFWVAGLCGDGDLHRGGGIRGAAVSGRLVGAGAVGLGVDQEA
jgi:hypothetical protein